MLIHTCMLLYSARAPRTEDTSQSNLMHTFSEVGTPHSLYGTGPLSSEVCDLVRKLICDFHTCTCVGVSPHHSNGFSAAKLVHQLFLAVHFPNH